MKTIAKINSLGSYALILGSSAVLGSCTQVGEPTELSFQNGGGRALFASDAVSLVVYGPTNLAPLSTLGSGGTPGPYPPQPIGATQGIVFNYIERYPDSAYPAGYKENIVRYGTYGIDYELRSMRARHSQEVFSAGVRPSDGKTVIEKWFFPAEPGGGVMTRGAMADIGTPIDPTNAYLDLVTDTYVDPPNRPRYHPIRSTVFLGTLTSGGVGSIAVDPERRFILVLSDDHPRKVWQITNLGPNATAQLLYSENSIPELADTVFVMVYLHPTEGRIYDLRPSPFVPSTEQHHILLDDPENDGILDSPPRIFDSVQWFNSPYGGGSNPWKEDYLYFDFHDTI